MSKSKIYKGAANFGLSLGTPIAIIDGNKIFKGHDTYGSPVGHINGDKIYKGDTNLLGGSSGTPIATIDGNKIYKGNSTYGSPLAHTDGDKSAALAGAAFLSFFS